MNDGDVPSPARAVQTKPAERHGLSPLPWESALYSAVSALEAELLACRKENAELHADIAQLRARLAQARKVHANWLLRRDAWHRERAELLARLGGSP